MRSLFGSASVLVCLILVACGGRLSDGAGGGGGSGGGDSDGGSGPVRVSCDGDIICSNCGGGAGSAPVCVDGVLQCGACPEEPPDASVPVDADAAPPHPTPDSDASISSDGGTAMDGSVLSVGPPCNPGACDSSSFCQEQEDFTFQCVPLPSQCTADDSCQCVLAHMTSHCPNDFGWDCGDDAPGVTVGCTAP